MATMTSKQLVDYLYYRKLPQLYRDADEGLGDFPLYRYLSAIIEGGYSLALNDINGLLDLVDPQKCPEDFLPYFCNSFGLEYFEDIDSVYQRKMLANIGEIVRRRGTYSCVRFLVRALTGMNVELEYIRGEYEGIQGRHLIITLLAESIDQINNMDTSRFVVERYVQTQIPYYIYPHIYSRIATQEVKSKVYRANVISTYTSYRLGIPNS